MGAVPWVGLGFVVLAASVGLVAVFTRRPKLHQVKWALFTAAVALVLVHDVRQRHSWLVLDVPLVLGSIGCLLMLRREQGRQAAESE
ncbi:hypothetical protein AB0942_33460 [Streptomyces nodosus]|uniref:hypothetical protein n=1 Tax=Streptomyces nodosus TaxID=40318 RepID=UPI003452B147